MFFRKRKPGIRHRIFSRNECPKVYCPECSRELPASCMKQNGSDNGEYYENWICDGCGCRFVAVYDGEDDGSDYIIQGVGSCNMKISPNMEPEYGPEVTSESDIRELMRRYPNLKTTEWCQNCDSEVEIRAYGLSNCPECGATLIPCSMCSTKQYDRCNRCPYERR